MNGLEKFKLLTPVTDESFSKTGKKYPGSSPNSLLHLSELKFNELLIKLSSMAVADAAT